jgi:FO synthase
MMEAELAANEPATPNVADLMVMPLADMLSAAAALRDQGHGRVQSWSRKVFIPLTQLCRNL